METAPPLVAHPLGAGLSAPAASNGTARTRNPICSEPAHESLVHVHAVPTHLEFGFGLFSRRRTSRQR